MKKIPTWSVGIIVAIIYITILFVLSFTVGGVGYRTLYLTPEWVSILVSLIFVLIAILPFAIKFRKPESRETETFVFYFPFIFVFGYIGYLAADVGIGLFYEINYWFREPERITTKAIVTDEKWDYETHEGQSRYRTHYVNVLELPEERREIKAVDGYIHCYPTGTEFDLVYSKGFFGIDILEGVDNVRYPSERHHMTTP